VLYFLGTRVAKFTVSSFLVVVVVVDYSIIMVYSKCKFFLDIEWGSCLFFRILKRDSA